MNEKQRTITIDEKNFVGENNNGNAETLGQE